MESLDKKEIGKRIKRLRKEKGLKQWQMADILGATQPAIHKYENGILPEVKRLMELARIGNTTIEWILTGRHWTNGSVARERVPMEIYQLAERFYGFSGEQQRILISALDMLEKAGRLTHESPGTGAADMDVRELARRLQEYDAITRKAIVAALGVHEAVLDSLSESRTQEFENLADTVSPARKRKSKTSTTHRPPSLHGEIV